MGLLGVIFIAIGFVMLLIGLIVVPVVGSFPWWWWAIGILFIIAGITAIFNE